MQQPDELMRVCDEQSNRHPNGRHSRFEAFDFFRHFPTTYVPFECSSMPRTTHANRAYYPITTGFIWSY